MKFYFLLLLTCWSGQRLFAQKPVIDSSAYDKWPFLEGQPLISNDGRFIVYDIAMGPEYRKRTKFFIRSTHTEEQIEIPDGVKWPRTFTSDSKYYAFINNNDSLGLLSMKTWEVKYIANVSGFKVPDSGNGEWLVYTLSSPQETTVIMNLRSGTEKMFPGRSSVTFSENGKELVLQLFSKDDHEENSRLEWINLAKWETKVVWSGKNPDNPVVDFIHRQLAFRVNDQIFYYKEGMSRVVSLTENNVNSDRVYKFNKEGDRLFISLKEAARIEVPPVKDAPEIWSYTDATLQTVQERGKTALHYIGVIGLSDHKLIQFKSIGLFNLDNEEKLLLEYQNGEGDYREAWWNSTAKKYYDLLDLKTGERKPLRFLDKLRFYNAGPTLSPDGKYILYYDMEQNNYISYEIASGKAYNLTKGISVSWRIDQFEGEWQLRGIAAWLPGNKGVLVYDSHDIWRLDCSGKQLPVNLTNGYGQTHNIIFNLVLQNNIRFISEKDILLLSALDRSTKNNGFFTKDMSKTGDPVKLSMGPYLYVLNSGNVWGGFDFNPIKAKNSKIYLLKRQSATEAPNYFCTSDFKTFKQLSHLEPQKAYNWYTSELHHWKSLNGETLQGILYKPENFDSSRKYPVIFYFYQKLSDGLNVFLMPEYNRGRIDVATYVSNGYLVFFPDIRYKLGDPMKGTYDAVVSAAKYLTTLSFVDAGKMGLQGHSFGGVQTNYLVTHTNLFAAACSASGLSDWVSGYGTLGGNVRDGFEGSLFGHYENTGQNRMGGPLWGNLDGFIQSSPIFQVDKITTPLLLMHTKYDGTCSYANIMEFFLGLRRLGKKAWMIVYNQGSHDLFSFTNNNESKDFTVRSQQFFDYYLRDKPAPLWMLDGVPAKNRAFGARIELDMNGRAPGPGLLIPEEQKKVDSLMNRKPISITIR